jgi:hypothetical protein
MAGFSCGYPRRGRAPQQCCEFWVVSICLEEPTHPPEVWAEKPAGIGEPTATSANREAAARSANYLVVDYC